MIYGYARVLTEAQELTTQLAQLKAGGCERVFREKISGATADRPQLRQLLAVATYGDVVIIPAVDRLSRDTTDLLVIARDLQKAGAGLRSLAEPVVDTTSDFAELVLAMLGVAAKLERRRIKERTALGRANATDRGVKLAASPNSPSISARKPSSGGRRVRRRFARLRKAQRLAPDDFEAGAVSNSRDNTERLGVNAVEAIFLGFKWAFRSQDVSDCGIDALVEIWEEEKFTGKLIALQIKSGKSYFRLNKDNAYVFTGSLRHLDYWTRHPLPVFLILHNPVTGLTLWQKIAKRFAIVNDKWWSIVISPEQILDAQHKYYLAEGIASDPESICRFNLAADFAMMKRLKDREVYFEINEWVNKSLNFRDVGVFFRERKRWDGLYDSYTDARSTR